MWLSVASMWEMVTKVQIGKLSLPAPVRKYVPRQLELNNVGVLSIQAQHVLRLESLPLHHRDPFDRILIAQSVEEGLPVMTADPLLRRYGIRVIW